MGTLYHSGTVITMEDPDAASPECVLTEGDRIVAVGAIDEIGASYGRDHEEVDLQGNVLMPAFINAHGHFMNYGVFSRQVDLRGCATVDDIVEALTQRLEEGEVSDDTPLTGVAYDHNKLPGYRHPTRHDLDRVSDTVPVFIVHQSSHMGVANSAALRAAGISASTPDPEGGRFGREADGTTPDGYVEEVSALMVFAQGFAEDTGTSPLAPGVQADPLEAIRTAQREYLSSGITTVQEGAASQAEVDALIAAGAAGELVVDVVAYPIVTADGLNVVDAHPKRVGQYVDHVRLGGCKLILDGSPQARSAWLSEPYEPEDSRETGAEHEHGPGGGVPVRLPGATGRQGRRGDR